MKLKNEETAQEKLDRLAAVDKNRLEFIRKVLPILTIILLIMIILLLDNNKREEEKNIGNPYECAECKELERACKEHKEFNPDEVLMKKIKNGIYQYKHYKESEDMEVYKYYLYGESYYNLECDFCTEKLLECDGCAYTRQAILGYIEEVVTDETVDRLCSDCKVKGYPYCNSDITYVSEMIYNLIKK